MFANPAIGLTKDEAYGNTPLHIACSLYSLDLAAEIAKICQESKTVKNNEGKTPLDIILSEIQHQQGNLRIEERALILVRLEQIRCAII